MRFFDKMFDLLNKYNDEGVDMICLGDLVMDNITGFTGVVVCIASYQFNSQRVGLLSRELNNGKPHDNEWFDISHIKIVMDGVVDPEVSGPQPFGYGDTVRDLLTDYQGVVTGFSQWINGCIRYHVQSAQLKDGRPVDEVYFPSQQLTLVSRALSAPTQVRSGGPMRNPSFGNNPR